MPDIKLVEIFGGALLLAIGFLTGAGVVAYQVIQNSDGCACDPCA